MTNDASPSLLTSPISSLIRAAIMVRDLETSTMFYRALGLTETFYEGTLDAASTDAVLHVGAEATTRCRIVRPVDRPNNAMVGLFEIRDAEMEALPPRGPRPAVGEIALVFYVADIEDTCHAARLSGASWVGVPATFVSPHRQAREVTMRDPDGVLVNLIERDLSEQDTTATIAERFG
jgi:catechol 2,3-dioxygenase-like lactoylglutathione lyase family enzyme